ncbi:Polyketide cyclase / dehydrase and lipid transport [Aquimarina amphilecti]|uniref:Polyketide cyclase / dehydrase and lipid transport n=1 Tax=Aquimarina amphilecti TaxID=1038014 RepID=A0A1H7J7I4_AQUAM|nr:SRPBCC family protein [Aquimarina amphilecti]SEK70324.1 Polyketide cyclase / dehydrase and lipid transport [Aquimarina amphilecti]
MKFQKTIQVAAPASKVWEVLWDDYGEVCQWASTVNTSETRKVPGSPDGGRTCVSTWGEISEIVEEVDEKNMMYRYYADGLPSMMKSAVNTWKVTSKSINTSEVSIDLEIEFATIPRIIMGWMIIPKMKKDIIQTLEDLRYFIETGKQTDAKIKSDQKYFKKNPIKAA